MPNRAASRFAFSGVRLKMATISAPSVCDHASTRYCALMPAPIMVPRSLLSATGAILPSLSEHEVEQVHDGHARRGDVAQRMKRKGVASEYQPPAGRVV